MSTVAAIIPSWNTASLLDRCLMALAAQEGVDIETVVVDNASKDGSLEVARRLGVAHIALTENIGFAAAVNLGAARTAAPFVLVLNADCFLAPDCVRLLTDQLVSAPELGGVQPLILQDGPGGESGCVYSAGQGLTKSAAAFEQGWGEPNGPRFSSFREIFGVTGAACLLRRELFTSVGGYDATYFAFFEDVELNARARLAGWGFAYVPGAQATHVAHAAWRQVRRPHAFNVELTVRNRLATAVKVLPPGAVLAAVISTARSLVASPRHGTTAAIVRALLTTVRWLPRLLGERTRLRNGSSDLLDDWLVEIPGDGPDPRRV